MDIYSFREQFFPLLNYLFIYKKSLYNVYEKLSYIGDLICRNLLKHQDFNNKKM